ncbi:MAG TPA: TetR/AcrR family transcriptional regulator [Chthoniobacterales bacterium]|nr:TetR/AcrR family transcriptional regulator [Chthoniobacterales bacterium]
MSSRLDTPTDRREQILRAAMICFARRGFHQASMHDISAEAGISVGLIYRYFENKDAVISAIADQHKQRVQELLERARQAPSLLEALEVLFTAHCCDNTPQVISAFVVDLFAEAGRNPRVADLVRDVTTTAMKGVTDLIAKSPEALAGMQNMSPRELAELIFALNDGMLMRDVLAMHRPPEQIRERQLKVARNLWRLLFSHSPETAIA